MAQLFNRKHYSKRSHPLTNLMKNTILKIEQEENRQNFIDKILNQYNSNKKGTPDKFHINLHKSPLPQKKISKGPHTEENKKCLQQIMAEQRLSVDNLKRQHKKISQRTNQQTGPYEINLIKSLSQKKQRENSQFYILPLESKISNEADRSPKYNKVSFKTQENNEYNKNLRRSQCIDNLEAKPEIKKRSQSDSDQQQAIRNQI